MGADCCWCCWGLRELVTSLLVFDLLEEEVGIGLFSGCCEWRLQFGVLVVIASKV